MSPRRRAFTASISALVLVLSTGTAFATSLPHEDGDDEQTKQQPATTPAPDVVTTDEGAAVSKTQTERLRRLNAQRSTEGTERPSDHQQRPPNSRPRAATGRAISQAEIDAACAQGEIAGTRAPGSCGEGRHATPPDPTDPAVPVRPSVDQITATVIRSETKHLAFPALTVQVEPRSKTLVNLDTNVYTTPAVFRRTVTVLTWPVRIRATPASYTWHFGDGTQLVTETAGAPHPDRQITHTYSKRGKVGVSVTVAYDTWYQVPGRDWQNAGTVPITGPATPLLVCEARPVLTDPDNPDAPDRTPDPTNPCTQ